MNWRDIYELIGPVGCVLVALGVMAVYISFWNVIYLVRVWREFRRDFLDIEKANGRRFSRYCANNSNPMVCIIRDVVLTHSAHSDDIRAEVAYLFHLNFKSLTNSLTWLKLIAAIAPLLGLLGTVLGMVSVFRTIADNAAPNPSLLAAGIWEALITTVLGLTVAIPVLMAYYYLHLKMKEFRIEAIEHSYRALELVKGKKALNPANSAENIPEADSAYTA